MKLVFFDPLRRVINARESFIEKNIKDSKKVQNKIEEQIANSNASSILASAREEAQKILSKAIDEASKRKDQLVSDAVKSNKNSISSNFIALEREEKDIAKNFSKYVEEISNAAIDQLMSEIEGRQKATV